MARNVEVKARIKSIDSIFARVAALADSRPVEINQDDTFFLCPNGRLKLRVFSSGQGELIFYRRANQAGPKESFYVVSSTSDPESLRSSLTLAYGQAGRVRKKRILFMAGRTRIHLDCVEDLGDFLELEVVLKECEDPASGEAIAKDLLNRLSIHPNQLIEGAYFDLLNGGG
jgi:predicted adenylyl cyclase CyaB